MTSKPKPTKASHYVQSIFKGLSTLLATDAASRLSAAVRNAVAEVSALKWPGLWGACM